MLDSMESNIPLDRTNWERGDADINYFALSVLYNGAAIPLYWQLLDNPRNGS